MTVVDWNHSAAMGTCNPAARLSSSGALRSVSRIHQARPHPLNRLALPVSLMPQTRDSSAARCDVPTHRWAFMLRP